VLAVYTRKAITDVGKSSYIPVCTGFWYEYTLANPAAFGIDLLERSVTFFDEGDTKISVSTWPQIGRAIVALLSLPIKSEASDKGPCLESFKNRVVCINSFTVSQKDMWQSALRTSRTKEDEWTITKQPAQERYSSGLKEIKEGKRIGYAKMMYSRVFYSDGCGDFEYNKGTLNSLLGLPEESIDDATKVAIERSNASNLAKS
jgi:hypothetical protein